MEKRTQLTRNYSLVGITLIVGLSVFFIAWKSTENHTQNVEFRNQQFEVFTINDPSKIVFGYKDSLGNQLKTFKNFKKFEASKGNYLYFAVNGGMFTKAFEPQGLYIQDKDELMAVDLDTGYGNFYLLPNGVFGISRDKPVVEETNSIILSNKFQNLRLATQSGPMLVINDTIHSAFNEGSKNKHIRNGVGINNAGEVVFVISNQRTNFYDFALLFKQVLNCSNALYLDGAISKMYNEESNRNEDGQLGVMIGVIK